MRWAPSFEDKDNATLIAHRAGSASVRCARREQALGMAEVAGEVSKLQAYKRHLVSYQLEANHPSAAFSGWKESWQYGNVAGFWGRCRV